jgi:hypothetical protein
LCDAHRLAVPGRHASAGASNIERGEEAKAEQTAECRAYSRGFSNGFEAGCKQTEEKAQPQFQPSPAYVVLVCFFLGITQSVMERYERFMARSPPCTKGQFYAAQPNVAAKVREACDEHLERVRAALAEERAACTYELVVGVDGSWHFRRNSSEGLVYMMVGSPVSQFYGWVISRCNMVKPSGVAKLDEHYNPSPFTSGASTCMEGHGVRACARELIDGNVFVDAIVHDQDSSTFSILSEALRNFRDNEDFMELNASHLPLDIPELSEYFDPNHQHTNVSNFVRLHPVLKGLGVRVDKLYRFAWCHGFGGAGVLPSPARFSEAVQNIVPHMMGNHQGCTSHSLCRQELPPSAPRTVEEEQHIKRLLTECNVKQLQEKCREMKLPVTGAISLILFELYITVPDVACRRSKKSNAGREGSYKRPGSPACSHPKGERSKNYIARCGQTAWHVPRGYCWYGGG